jgi:alpha-beta hydrolase superfamily lysophospholipase
MTVTPGDAAAPRPRRHRIRNTFLVVVAMVAIVAGYLFLKPVAVAVPASTGMATASWDDAAARVHAIQVREAEDPTILPECRTRLYDHGAPTDDVVVLFHGYTNCPKQYDALAQQLADRGYTVLVPRMPHHGEVPGTPGLLDSLTGEQVAAHADETMDIADGLGDRITVFGLSGGGAVASYIAQFRPDADRVVAAAPFLGIPAVPGWLTPAAINAIDLAPPIDQRDPAPDEATRGAFPHGASDTSTHGAAAYMRVGQTVLDAAAKQAPKAGRIVAVVNDADTTVNNAMVEDLAGRWANLAPDRASVYHFDASLKVLHDMITPDRDGEKVDLVYPVIIDLMSRS